MSSGTEDAASSLPTVQTTAGRLGPRWEDPFPWAIFPLDSDSDWAALEAQYRRAPGNPGEIQLDSDRALRRCLEVARVNEARTAVVETRYIDADYRSEYSTFYSRAFAHFEDSTHRVHFFQAVLRTEEDIWRLPSKPGYLGYMVIRPQVRGVVGRTMLRPPEEIRRAVRTAVTENVTFFGQQLPIKAVPFMQQDARLASCAHAAAWMCHHSAFRADRGVARRVIAEFSQAVDASLGVGRSLPSTGLTLNQLSDVLASFGLPPLHYEVGKLNDSDRPESWPSRSTGHTDGRTKRLCCRYLNSGMPVLAVVRQSKKKKAKHYDLHAVVACGYLRDGDGSHDVTLITNDDRRGPYLMVKRITNDFDESSENYLSWDQVLAPLPEKLWMSGEAAERTGCGHLIAAAQRAVEKGIAGPQLLLDRHSAGKLTVRTYAMTANRFKSRMRKRCKDDEVVRAYMLARLPRYVWVVEAIDRTARDAAPKEAGARDEGVPCVLGEVVFDATSDDLYPDILATRLPGVISVPRPDGDWDAPCGSELITSGGEYDP